MRIRISHETVYHYDQPPNGVIQNLRLTPRNHDGQFVIDWRVDVSQDCRLDEHEDAFGNISHAFTADGPFSTLSVRVDGEIETQDTNGFVRGAVERFPPSLFLRETALTLPDESLIAFADELRPAAKDGTLGLMHALMDRLHEDITYDTDPTNSGTTAAEAFAMKSGVCQDATHIFLAVARTLGVPARYVGGYFHRADGVTAQEAAMPGPKPSFRISAGSHSIRPTASAPPMPMSASPSVSTISARRRCAARATAAARRRCRSPCRSIRPGARRRVEADVSQPTCEARHSGTRVQRAGPESIRCYGGYGFRARELRSRPGMTPR